MVLLDLPNEKRHTSATYKVHKMIDKARLLMKSASKPVCGNKHSHPKDSAVYVILLKSAAKGFAYTLL